MKEIELTCKIGREISEVELKAAAAKALGVSPKSVGECRLVRRSVDARTDVLWRLRYQVCKMGEQAEKYELAPYRDVHSAPSVIVVGAGPAGMFAALKLLTLGLKPVVLERGRDVHARKVDVARLSDKGIVNPDSNYCCGEGDRESEQQLLFRRGWGRHFFRRKALHPFHKEGRHTGGPLPAGAVRCLRIHPD